MSIHWKVLSFPVVQGLEGQSGWKVQIYIILESLRQKGETPPARTPENRAFGTAQPEEVQEVEVGWRFSQMES